MTDNIFELETTAVLHVACAPHGSCILLTDFAAAYPSFNHSWIYHALEKLSCLSSSAVFCGESVVTALHAGRTRGQFLMAIGVRQGCPARGFLFSMAFDHIFRWLHVAPALSFRGLMAGLAPAFHSMDHTAGLNLNLRKCCWVQYGSESRESQINWLSGNCEEFGEMQIVRFAKCVGTMIGPRWPLRKSSSVYCKSTPLPKSSSSDCSTSRSKRCLFEVTLAPYAHLTKLLSKLRPMPCSVLLQDHTMLFPPAYWALVPCVALVLT